MAKRMNNRRRRKERRREKEGREAGGQCTKTETTTDAAHEQLQQKPHRQQMPTVWYSNEAEDLATCFAFQSGSELINQYVLAALDNVILSTAH